MTILKCPFCGATPHRGRGPVMHDQLHGDPVQWFRIWCPHSGYAGSHARVEAPNESMAIAAWNTRTKEGLT